MTTGVFSEGCKKIRDRIRDAGKAAFEKAAFLMHKAAEAVQERVFPAARGFLTRAFDDILAIAGCALISYGAALIYRPLGYIAAGAACIAWAVIWSRGGGGSA